MGWQDLQRYVLFPRHLAWPDPAIRPLVDGLQEHWIEDRGVRVEGWFLPATGEPLRRAAVIFCHGNAELIDHWPLALRRYRELGVHVLLPEYRGYGRSGGLPTEEAIAADLVRFYDWLAERDDVDPRRIIFHGRSLGGGAVCALARQRTPSALILQSTFTSVPAVARRFGIPRALIRDRFESLAVVESFRGAQLVIHGENDELIPVLHARQLHAAGANSELYLDHGDHNTTPTDNERYWRAIEELIVTAQRVPL
ncbi:MAG: alpha/beta hydrolase [Myxococcales bacterium]|nr:alpha/beta hydrolase [Myxococcales bacterium]